MESTSLSFNGEFECVSYIACLTGSQDLSIQVYARDNEGLSRFVAEVMAVCLGSVGLAP